MFISEKDNIGNKNIKSSLRKSFTNKFINKKLVICLENVNYYLINVVSNSIKLI